MRRVRRKGGNKEKVFGCDLLEHLTASSQEIPLVLRCCSEFVEQNGIVDGIYRLSGVSSNIQKLRGEFESDGSPDLNKDVYLQDIHCVSSLCKAYFRELPNPLLTYQLYDKFAEAVAIQLEEERLVKIRDVLKELPAPHYGTLEFLMRHLVKMASYSSETNMHARNLAIVWAPNLLRSKDIEASGFNGTAAFMEVRVQSIVVEFILTHVPQLFPEHGVSTERRKSLPSPTAAMSNQDEGFFRTTQPIANFGNISPGDGPIPIRPYTSIIEGTDKRKGSLKGRKWMSIFNIGGRFHDPRRRHKHSTKEKERPVLRPARSMDSLSTPSYPNEGSRLPAQRLPSTNMSPTITPSPQSGSDVTVSAGAIGGSEYAVTYRRGTGLVSGGAGTQGTYTALDPEGLGIAGSECLQSRSPGLSTKVGRRAAMHITGPTMVTVPLHITSNLALGVLQGGGGNRVIHCGRDKNGGDKVEGKEGGEKAEKKESRGMERKVDEGRKVEKEEESHRGRNREVAVDMEGNTEAAGGVGEEKGEGAEEKGDEEVGRDCGRTPELEMVGRSVSRERRAKSLNSNTEEDNDEDAGDDEQDVDDGYMEMRGMDPADHQPAVTQHGDEGEFEASEILNSTEVEGDDQELSGYVQDNFEFLDQMDCSVLDHMDCSVPYQVNEFSVEPPGHSDDEYEIMEQAQPSHEPAEQQTRLQPGPETHTESQPELKPHRPLSLDIHSRHTKSLSLPYITSPVHGPEESSSEEELVGGDSDDNDYSSDEDESMFVKSLPPDFFLNTLTGFERDTVTQDTSTPDPPHRLQTSEETECQGPNLELSAWKETTAVDQEQVEVKDGEDEDGLEEQEKKEEEDDEGRDELEKDMQSGVLEEKSLPPEASALCWMDFPPPSSNESNNVTGMKMEEEKKVVEIPHSDYLPRVSGGTQKERADLPLGVTSAERPRSCGEAEDSRVYKQVDDICQQNVLEIKEGNENVCEEPAEEGDGGIAHQKHEGSREQDRSLCRTNSDIWIELEDIICEVIEDEESKQSQKKGAAGQAEVVRDGEEGGQTATARQEKMAEVDEAETNSTDVRLEVEEESSETLKAKLTDPEMQQEFEEDETYLPRRSELEKTTQEKHAFNEEAQYHDRREVVSKQPEKENNDKERAEHRRTPPSGDKQRKEARYDRKERRKCETSDSSLGGVGRKLVISKHPKVYQVKAVPVVPPKPQHCKITALTLRQQQQQRERRDADRGRENLLKVCAGEQVRDGDVDDESAERKEKPTLRGGDRERERERRRDGAEGATRDMSRNSPLSMCFDEAVAIATMRREKERVRDGDGESEGLGK